MGNKNWMAWFEIPAGDFNRAKTFYETIFNIEIQTFVDTIDFKMGIFPHREVGGGAICCGEWYKPSADGVLIYLDANPDLSEVLNRVEEAGGKILQAKKLITPEHGFRALFIDSEGNRVALHSLN